MCEDLAKQGFQHNSSNIESGEDHDQRNVATKFCSDWLSPSHFILQTSNCLFINVTAVTLGQGHTMSSSTFPRPILSLSQICMV